MFLIYYPRSGSTLLSARLDRFEDISVTVESKLMREVLLAERKLSRATSPGEAYDLVEKAGRISNLGLSRESFSRHLEDSEGYGVEEVTHAILSAYFEATGPDSKVWVVKDGLNGYWIERISKELPDAKFIHVVRDGRAVFNSVLRTSCYYGTEYNIARDPVSVSRSWSRFVAKVNGFAARNPGRCVVHRYEDLLADEEGELDRLRRSFGLGDGRREEVNGYYERMPERDRAIHDLVSGETVPGRAGAWKEELDRGYRMVFEYGARRTLKELGYETAPANLPRLLLDRGFLAAHAASAALRARRRLRMLLDPISLWRVIAAKRLAWKDASLHTDRRTRPGRRAQS